MRGQFHSAAPSASTGVSDYCQQQFWRDLGARPDTTLKYFFCKEKQDHGTACVAANAYDQRSDKYKLCLGPLGSMRRAAGVNYVTLSMS